MLGSGSPKLPHPPKRNAAAAYPSPEVDVPSSLVSARAPEVADVARSFESFYEAESRTLFRRLWLVTGNRAEAEEIMQDAFLKLWEHWPLEPPRAGQLGATWPEPAFITDGYRVIMFNRPSRDHCPRTGSPAKGSLPSGLCPRQQSNLPSQRTDLPSTRGSWARRRTTLG